MDAQNKEKDSEVANIGYFRCVRNSISKKEPPIIIHHTNTHRKEAKILLHVELFNKRRLSLSVCFNTKFNILISKGSFPKEDNVQYWAELDPIKCI